MNNKNSEKCDDHIKIDAQQQVQIQNLKDQLINLENKCAQFDNALRNMQIKGCTYCHLFKEDMDKMQERYNNKIEEIEKEQSKIKTTINRWGGALTVFGMIPVLISVIYMLFQIHLLISKVD